ncbi:hypothetical protein EV384_1876 [Micromonospora kangleipakensis]|uniref:Uncharacterized protein n=1 Tax=Micromonospora kangleipakensis TaxID=1077942 RepID=A0A4Q8B8H8_9ACTN|nr:hypothetical protein [Micromonospora kangleipakensis]RZU73471.1 hypothetical protein EV384_1876 [Micromonospora kangleipakensis]
MKATQDPTTEVQVTPADLLRMAALYLRRHGWHQGTYYCTDVPADYPTPPACAVGAIGIACAGHRVNHFSDLNPDDRHAYLDAIAVLTDYLDDHYPIHLFDDDGNYLDDHTSPYSWNDDPLCTAEHVITALEGAAQEWDRLHHQGGENR